MTNTITRVIPSSGGVAAGLAVLNVPLPGAASNTVSFVWL